MRLEALQSVAIAVSQERSLELVLNRIVQGLAGSGGIALTRIWLIGPANKCEVCRRRGVSPDKVLHLAASAGRSIRGVGP